jgi:pyoverdine/dityrosine biosynthesis protein Dit1
MLARKHSNFDPDALLDLAVAILAQAIKDIKSQNKGQSARAVGARIWLVSTGTIWFDCLGVDGEFVYQAIIRQPTGKRGIELSRDRKRKTTLSEPEEYR